MSFICLLPVVISFIVLSAHFLRDGSVVLVGGCLLMPFLLLIPRRWVVYVIQFALVLGGVEWIFTIVAIAKQRQENDQPWMRMVIILGSVTLFTVASNLVFAMPRLRRRYAKAMA